MPQKVSSHHYYGVYLGLYIHVVPESVLNALTSNFFPGGKGYGGLPAARDAGSYIKETFGAYGFIDPVDKKRCTTKSPSSSKEQSDMQQIGASLTLNFSCPIDSSDPN